MKRLLLSSETINVLFILQTVDSLAVHISNVRL
jgi:hypothetical protein